LIKLVTASTKDSFPHRLNCTSVYIGPCLYDGYFNRAKSS
jgi:hypothetical protein